jgi:hypothetical protein
MEDLFSDRAVRAQTLTWATLEHFGVAPQARVD